MAFIDTVSPEQAGEAIGTFYRAQQGPLDYLPNYARLYSHRPAVMAAWADLQRELKRHLEPRVYSLISLAAALATGSSYCALAHGQRLLQAGFSADELVAAIQEEGEDPLSHPERCMVELAGKVAAAPAAVEQGDIDRLREAGFSDAEIFDVVAAAAGRCFFARVPDALGALPDAPLGDMDETLLRLLLVGRPLEQEGVPQP